MSVHYISTTIPTQQLSFHHELTLKPAREVMEEWNNIVSQDSRRCRYCWLRYYNCFCTYLNDKRAKYHQLVSQYSNTTKKFPSITVTIYYHYHEIGRSANTMHILEILCPSICQNIILGDINQETQMLQRILQIQDDERLGKCSNKIAVLYPSPDSVTIPNWLNYQNLFSTEERKQTSSSTVENIELIVLDGTYGQAARLLNHLRKMIERINLTSSFQYRVPVVKLDLGESGQCSSAIIGVMKQPSGEKICSLQAVIMALQQCGVSSTLCDSLNEDLNSWLSHILESQIKKGKRLIVLPRVGDSSGDPDFYQPIDSISSFLSNSVQVSNKIPSKNLSKKKTSPRTTITTDIADFIIKRKIFPKLSKVSNIVKRSTSRFSVYDLRENISDYDACYQIDICPLQEWNNQHIKAIEILVSHY